MMKKVMIGVIASIIVIVVFAHATMSWITNSCVAALESEKSEFFGEIQELDDDIIRKKNYWITEDESMMDLGLYLKDYGCNKLKVSSKKVRGVLELRYSFECRNRIFEIETLVPADGERASFFGEKITVLRMFSADGVWETHPSLQPITADCEQVSDRDTIFMTSRTALSQLICMVQFRIEDDNTLAKLGLVKIL